VGIGSSVIIILMILHYVFHPTFLITAGLYKSLAPFLFQDGNARSPVAPNSEHRRPSNSKLSADNLVDVDLSSPAPQSNLDAVFTSTPKIDAKSGSALAARSRSSSISSQASDASFLAPQSFSVAGQASFVSADDQASVSEAETEDHSAVLASTTKEDMYRMYTKMQRRGQQYKWKYLQVGKGKELLTWRLIHLYTFYELMCI
jgi:hypothetical protein